MVRLFLPRLSHSQLLLIEDELHAVIMSGSTGAWRLYAPDYEVPERVAEGVRMLAEGQRLKRSVHDFEPSPKTMAHLRTMTKLFLLPSSDREIRHMERVLRQLIRRGLKKEKTLVLNKTGDFTKVLGFQLHQLALSSTLHTP